MTHDTIDVRSKSLGFPGAQQPAGESLEAAGTVSRRLPVLRRVCWLRAGLCAIALATASVSNGFAQPNELPVDYGGRSRGDSRVSLNGVSGFANLVEQRGVKVQSWYQLSPRIDDYRHLVWFPDETHPLNADVQERLETWLSDGYQRTLVIVGRDYDAAVDYLRQAADKSEGEERDLYERRWAEAVSQKLARSLQYEALESEIWVDWVGTPSAGVAQQLSGDLVANLDVSQSHVVQGRHPVVPATSDYDHQILMQADSTPFVIEVTSPNWSEGRILIVSNGSFLLNYGLTYPGNVRLANRLIDEFAPDTDVLFLESGERGLRVVDREQNRQNTIWDWIQEWPFQFFIPHFIVLGILFYFVYLPIFGRPRRVLPPSSSDFGQHVEALGELMERTHDQDYAVQHLKHYHEQVRRDSSGIGTRRSSP